MLLNQDFAGFDDVFGLGVIKTNGLDIVLQFLFECRNLLSQRFDRIGQFLDLTVASCNGATIDNILTVPQGDNPLQIDAVTSDTKLVTVTSSPRRPRTVTCAGSTPISSCASRKAAETTDSRAGKVF